MEVTKKQPVLLTEVAQSKIDLLRATLLTNFSRTLVNDIANSKATLPEGMNMNVLRQTVEAMDRFSREIKRTVGKTGTYLDNSPKRDMVIDAVSMIECLFRISSESRHMYEDFQGLVIDLIDTVFFSHQHRKAIYFPKYKKLFQIIAEEVRRETSGEPVQIEFINGELFFKVNTPAHQPKIS